MKKIIIVLFLTLSIFADDKNEIEFFEYYLPKDLSYLHLSKKQKDSIEVLLIKNNKTLEKLKKQKEKIEEYIQKAFISGKFTKELYIKKTIKLKKEYIKTEAILLEGFFKILNKEQRKKFMKHFEEWEIE